MWSSDRTARLLCALTLAAFTAGCGGGGFQPMYGSANVGGVSTDLKTKLSEVDVQSIDTPQGTRLARVGGEVRNDLIYNLTGGGPAGSPTHKLIIRLSSRQ